MSQRSAFDEHTFRDCVIEAGRDGPVAGGHQVLCARLGGDSPAMGA